MTAATVPRSPKIAADKVMADPTGRCREAFLGNGTIVETVRAPGTIGSQILTGPSTAPFRAEARLSGSGTRGRNG